MNRLFNINLEIAIKHNITIKQLYILEGLYLKDIDSLTMYSKTEGYQKDDFMNLIGNGYIINNNIENESIFLSKLEITIDGVLLLKDCLNIDKVNLQLIKGSELNWIDEYYNIFPKGVRTSGYFVKGDKKSCEKKLIKFLKENPAYNKEIIIAATTRYVSDMKNRGYSYMQTAAYFIEKNGNSALAGYCENELTKTNKDGKVLSNEKVEGI